MEDVEHEVGDLREISAQVLKEQGRTRVCKALSSIDCDKPYEAINS
jgi:hypothetical protein